MKRNERILSNQPFWVLFNGKQNKAKIPCQSLSSSQHTIFVRFRLHFIISNFQFRIFWILFGANENVPIFLPHHLNVREIFLNRRRRQNSGKTEWSAGVESENGHEFFVHRFGQIRWMSARTVNDSRRRSNLFGIISLQYELVSVLMHWPSVTFRNCGATRPASAMQGISILLDYLQTKHLNGEFSITIQLTNGWSGKLFHSHL